MSSALSRGREGPRHCDPRTGPDGTVIRRCFDTITLDAFAGQQVAFLVPATRTSGELGDDYRCRRLLSAVAASTSAAEASSAKPRRIDFTPSRDAPAPRP